jgi:hypothetical protein
LNKKIQHSVLMILAITDKQERKSTLPIHPFAVVEACPAVTKNQLLHFRLCWCSTPARSQPAAVVGVRAVAIAALASPTTSRVQKINTLVFK